MSNRIDGNSPGHHVDATDHSDHAHGAKEAGETHEAEESSFWGAVDDLSDMASSFKDDVVDGAKQVKEKVHHEVAEVEEKAKAVVDRAEKEVESFVEETTRDIEETKAGFEKTIGIAKEMAEDLEIVKDAKELVDTAEEIGIATGKLADAARGEVDRRVEAAKAEANETIGEVGEEMTDFANDVSDTVLDSGKRLSEAKDDLYKRAEGVVRKSLEKPQQHAEDSVREFSGAFDSVKSGLDDIMEGRGFESGLQKVGKGLDLGIRGLESTNEGIDSILGSREETFDRLESITKHGALQIAAEALVVGAKVGEEGYELVSDARDVLGVPDGSFDHVPPEQQEALKALVDQVGGPLRTLVATQEFIEASDDFAVRELLDNPDGLRSLVMRASPLERAEYVRSMEVGDKETTTVGFEASIHEGVGGKLSFSNKIEIARGPDDGDNQVVTVSMSKELAAAAGIGFEFLGEGGKLDVSTSKGGAVTFSLRDPDAAAKMADWVERGAKLDRLLDEPGVAFASVSGDQAISAELELMGGKLKAGPKLESRLEGFDVGDEKLVTELSYSYEGGVNQGFTSVQIPASTKLGDAKERVDFIVNEHPDSLPAELVGLVGRERFEAMLATHDARTDFEIGMKAEVKAQTTFDVSDRTLEKVSFTLGGEFTTGNNNYTASAELTINDAEAALNAANLTYDEVLADLNEGKMSVEELQSALTQAGFGDSVTLEPKVEVTTNDRQKFSKLLSFDNNRSSTRDILGQGPQTVGDLAGTHVRL